MQVEKLDIIVLIAYSQTLIKRLGIIDILKVHLRVHEVFLIQGSLNYFLDFHQRLNFLLANLFLDYSFATLFFRAVAVVKTF
jgi:hypothetical protein